MKSLVILTVASFAVAAPALAQSADITTPTDGSCQPASSGIGGFGHDLGSIFGAIGHGFKKIGNAIVDGAAESVGYVELAGIRYPITSPYQQEVSPTFWRGSRLGDAQMADLKARGFKATVDLTKEGTGDADNAPKYGMNTMNVPILDNGTPTQAQMLDMLAYVTAPDNQPVYVHCEAGVGRTSIATAVYQMAVLGVTPAAALADAKAHGMGLANQQQFVQQFGADLQAGKFPGYPMVPMTNAAPTFPKQAQGTAPVASN